MIKRIRKYFDVISERRADVRDFIDVADSYDGEDWARDLRDEALISAITEYERLPRFVRFGLDR